MRAACRTPATPTTGAGSEVPAENQVPHDHAGLDEHRPTGDHGPSSQDAVLPEKVSPGEAGDVDLPARSPTE